MPSDEIDIRETYVIQEEVARSAGWDDPRMDVYNDHNAHYKHIETFGPEEMREDSSQPKRMS